MNNLTFLKAIFGDDAPFAHVTQFSDDPSNISQDRRGICWGGGYAKDVTYNDKCNQYFTISTFSKNNSGKPCRSKEFFLKTHVIVLDDVKEKLDINAVLKLPKPSYILETSPGSEQWGYILTHPCENRSAVESLLFGLVKKGLAPDGRDPGMTGVTRYVRLPDGVNTKSSKLVDGKPFKCRLVEFKPYRTVTIQELAEPFNINVDENNMDTSKKFIPADILDHPILSFVNVTKKRGVGRYDITCPWVNEHTGKADNGSMLFTNSDGSIGFECHHGHCSERTKFDLEAYLDSTFPTFKATYFPYLASSMFKIEKQPNEADILLNELLKELPNSERARELVKTLLKSVDKLAVVDQIFYHKEICDFFRWSKTEFNRILKDHRKTYIVNVDENFFNDFVFVKACNAFYEYRTGKFARTENFHNNHVHLDQDIKNKALRGAVEKVDGMDFCPKMPRIFTRNNIVYANGWDSKKMAQGTPGDVTPWLNHFDVLGFGQYKEQLLQYMAFTILRPEEKINYIVLIGGAEGIGKDCLLHPLKKAMEPFYNEVDGKSASSEFNSFLVNVKYLHFNETELGDAKTASEIYNKLKPLAAAPPETLMVNPKHADAYHVQNIVNVTMTTNSTRPVKIQGNSRRFFALWSNLKIYGQTGILDDWQNYLHGLWSWLYGGGTEYCIHYLRNCVDLSTFNPKAHPPVTDFLRAIQDDSKNYTQLTLENLIREKVGAFKNDLVTIPDILHTVRAADLSVPDLMLVSSLNMNSQNIEANLKNISSCTRLSMSDHYNNSTRVWCIRNIENYMRLVPKGIFSKYNAQESYS